MENISVKNKTINKRELKETFTGWLFLLPVILGLALFTAVPFAMSFWYSFLDYQVLKEPIFINIQNYINLFQDAKVLNSFGVTFSYTIISVGMSLVLSFLLALLLNVKLPGLKVFRILIYIPVIIPSVAAAAIWKDLLNPTYIGTFNRFLALFGLQPFPFFASEKTAMASMILLSIWGLGGNMLMWIAGFNGVSPEYYEAAELDGASKFNKMIKITLPMVSPIIFYNLIMSVIASLQSFGSAYLLTGGGLTGSTNFITLNIYMEGIVKMNMGYASAQAWVLFAIIMVLTCVIFKTSGWVFYGDGDGK